MKPSLMPYCRVGIAKILLGGVIFLETLSSAQAKSGARNPAFLDAPKAFYTNLRIATRAITIKNWKTGVDAGRAAWQMAPNVAEKVLAARLVASAYFHAERYLMAQLWLRRAFNIAADSSTRRVLRKEYTQVHKKNPLTISLGFSIGPSANINNGSSERTVTIGHIPFSLNTSAKAIPGIALGASIEASYRLPRSQMRQTTLHFGLYGRTYKLSSAASKPTLGIKGSDYAFAVAEASLVHEKQFTFLTEPTSLRMAVGKTWYGNKPYSKYWRVSIGQVVNLSVRTTAHVYVVNEVQRLRTPRRATSNIHIVGGSVNRQLGNGDALSAMIKLSRTFSNMATTENTATKFEVHYKFAKQINGMNLSLYVAGEKRNYAVSAYASTGRHDLSAAIGIKVTFPRITFYGFRPTINAEIGQTKSNVSFYNRQVKAVQFGIQSAF